MNNNIFAGIVALALRIKFHFSKKSPTINIINHLTEAKNILIFMPHKIEHFGVALKSLAELKTKRPQWNITVIAKVEMATILEHQLNVEILPFSNQHINVFGLPKDSLKKHFEGSSYDVALDFLFTFDLLCIKLFQLCGAPLKVCFYSRKKSSFYNFGIRVNAMEELANKYSAMVKYITVMGNRKIQESEWNKTAQ